jgi:hypothetical protein
MSNNFHKGDIVMTGGSCCDGIRPYTNEEIKELQSRHLVYSSHAYVDLRPNTMLIVLRGRARYKYFTDMSLVLNPTTGQAFYVKRYNLVGTS